MALSARQRLSAWYYQTLAAVCRNAGSEYYAMQQSTDMNGRVTLFPAHVAFDTPLDWRSVNRAHTNTMPYRVALNLAWILWMQSWAAAHTYSSHPLQYTWWLPGSLLYPIAIALLHHDASIAWNGFLALFVGIIAIDTLTRIVIYYQSMDRLGLSTERGSAHFATPEELAGPTPDQNMFPPGYDIWGGFDERQRRGRIVDLERIDAHEEKLFYRQLLATSEEIDVPESDSPALPRPTPTRTNDLVADIADILDGIST